jgi:WD40 repeat protein
MNKTINDAHDSDITKVIYNSKGNLISCSSDGLIKIWELKNGEYKNIKTLNHFYYIESILLLENKNILISYVNGIKYLEFKK